MQVHLIQVWGTHDVEKIMICDSYETVEKVLEWDQEANPDKPLAAWEVKPVNMFTLNDHRLKNGKKKAEAK
jgi:hypothetical protein